MRLRSRAFFLSLWFETLLYGIYFVLFCFCVWILLRHRRPGFVVLLSTAIVIFAFSTFHVMMGLKMALGAFFEGDRLREGGADMREQRKDHMTVFGLCGRSLAYVMNNFLTDALIVYRCYAVWNFNTYLIILPVLLVLITSMVGVNPTGRVLQLPREFFILSLVTNILVTTMAAGRLWWLTHKARKFLSDQPALKKRYRAAFFIILESGSIYSILLILFIILREHAEQRGTALVFQDALAQVMGIVPTLIIVLVGLGKETNPRPESMSKPLLA